MRRAERPAERSASGVRTFICLEIPESVKARIAELQQRLRSIEAHASWVKPSNIHLTLKFLGNVPESRLATLRRGVERAAASASRFEVEVSGTGSFPSARNPRVLWIGLGSLPDALRSLYLTLEDELEREGFARESKPLSPHLTIARIKTPHNARRLAEETALTGFAPESFEATEIIIMRSDLSPGGSIYTPQAIVPLGGPV